MKKLLTATVLAATLAFGIGTASTAFALIIKSENLPDGGHVENVHDDDGTWLGSHFYDKDNKHTLSVYPDSNPGPDGDSGSGPTKGDVQAALDQLLKNGGGDMTLETDFWGTPFGLELVESGASGSIIPYHNPADSLAYDFEGGGHGGPGGIDLNGGSITEQIKNNGGKKKKDNDDGDDGGGSGDPGTGDDDLEFGGASADMELVNPVPVLHPQSSAMGTLMTRQLQGLATSLRPRTAMPSSVATQALRSPRSSRTIR